MSGAHACTHAYAHRNAHRMPLAPQRALHSLERRVPWRAGPGTAVGEGRWRRAGGGGGGLDGKDFDVGGGELGSATDEAPA